MGLDQTLPSGAWCPKAQDSGVVIMSAASRIGKPGFEPLLLISCVIPHKCLNLSVHHAIDSCTFSRV